jgi:hypothetical protein
MAPILTPISPAPPVKVAGEYVDFDGALVPYAEVVTVSVLSGTVVVGYLTTDAATDDPISGRGQRLLQSQRQGTLDYHFLASRLACDS